MAQYTTTTFDRISSVSSVSEYGDGQTTEYRTAGSMPETLAYVDYTADRTEAWVTVFNPYRAGERRYSRRPAARAEAIAIKHSTNY